MEALAGRFASLELPSPKQMLRVRFSGQVVEQLLVSQDKSFVFVLLLEQNLSQTAGVRPLCWGTERLAEGSVPLLTGQMCPWLLLVSMAPTHSPELLLGQAGRKAGVAHFF